MRRALVLLLLAGLATPVAADARRAKRLPVAAAHQLAERYADALNAEWDEDAEGSRFAEVDGCRRLAARLVACQVLYVEEDADCSVAYVVRLKRNRVTGAPGTPLCVEVSPDEPPEEPDADVEPEPGTEPEPSAPPPSCGLPVCPAR